MSDPTIYDKKFDKKDGKDVIKYFVLAGTFVQKDWPLHWRIYNKINDQKSVMFDMTPGGDGETGLLMIESKPYGETRSSKCTISVPVTKEMKVDDLIASVKELHRSHYKFSSNGAGCRWWCETILSDLEGRGYVKSGAVKEFEARIEKENKTQPKLFPLPTIKGTFY